MNNVVATIDFGSTGIRCIVGNIQNKNIKILAKAETKVSFYKKGDYYNDGDLRKSLSKMQNMIEERLGTPIESAYINLSGEFIKFFEDEAEIDIEKVDRLIVDDDIENLHLIFKDRYEDAQWKLIDIISQSYTIDGYEGIPDPLGMIGNKLKENANIIISQRSYLKKIVTILKEIGIKAEGVIFSPMAIFEIILKTNDEKDNVAIIDCGGKLTEIYIFKNRKLGYYETFNLGGNNITKDILYGHDLSEEEAESLKKSQKFTIKEPIETKIHSCIDIIEARTIEILEIIKEKFNTISIFKDIDNIIITGQGLSHFKGLEEVAEIILKKKIRVDLGKSVGINNADYLNGIGMLKYIMNGLDEENKKEIPRKKEKISFIRKLLTKIGKS